MTYEREKGHDEMTTQVNACNQPIQNAALAAMDADLGQIMMLDSGLWSADAANDVLGNYPLVWTALFDCQEDDTDELTRQAENAQVQLYDEVYIPTLAQAIYTIVYGHFDNHPFRNEKLSEIEDWLREGNIGEWPAPEILAGEWREYDDDTETEG